MNELNILQTNYNQTGKSRETDANGMLEMQVRAFKERDSQYLLIKSPPASGKSRALMFLGLDKLRNQGLKKVIVAVPEMTIGASFRTTKLTDYGFFSDWVINSKYNLCIPGGEGGKVDAFTRFLKDEHAEILLCTHATLRFAFQKVQPSDFDNILLGIDEFHHSSAADDNRLGEAIDGIIEGSSAHIVAMTGSYFRGDAVPVMAAEYERMFKQVTYSYYDQLNGYKHLKSLGMNYHFHQGNYLTAIHQVLDTTKKTIVHIPSVNSRESTKDKYNEIDTILSVIGDVVPELCTDEISVIRTKDGRLLKVADLVNDDKTRVFTQNYLSNITSADDLDIIIALGMAKEGFDWVWCEHVLTVGYRSSLTEVVQIIGRATRDCEGKEHAQFTNLVAEPDADHVDIKSSVNNLLKAITLSLLMQQVLTPNVQFKPRSRMTDDDFLDGSIIAVDDSVNPASDRVAKAFDDIANIQERLLQNGNETIAPLMTGQQDLNTFRDYEIAKVVSELHPELDLEEVDMIVTSVHTAFVTSAGGGVIDGKNLPEDAEFLDLGEHGSKTSSTSQPKPSIEMIDGPDKSYGSEKLDRNGVPVSRANSKFIMIDSKFIDVEDMNLDLVRETIENTNPFEKSFSVVAHSITPDALKSIEQYVSTSRSGMTATEASALHESILEFKDEYGRLPELSYSDHYENRLALALGFLKESYRKKQVASSSEQEP